MYLPTELARFALTEFQRGLEGLTDEEAQVQFEKADGTRMNAISWTVGHIAGHWLALRGRVTEDILPGELAKYRSGPAADPTPPPLDRVLALLRQAEQGTDWIDDRALELTSRELNIGTTLMRAILHTWFHAGEINAARQMLGHPEIAFVGPMAGSLEWRPNAV